MSDETVKHGIGDLIDEVYLQLPPTSEHLHVATVAVRALHRVGALVVNRDDAMNAAPVYRIARRATPTARFGACSAGDVVYRSREAADARLAKILELQASLVRCFPLTYAPAEYRIEQATPAWEAA